MTSPCAIIPLFLHLPDLLLSSATFTNLAAKTLQTEKQSIVFQVTLNFFLSPSSFPDFSPPCATFPFSLPVFLSWPSLSHFLSSNYVCVVFKAGFLSALCFPIIFCPQFWVGFWAFFFFKLSGLL